MPNLDAVPQRAIAAANRAMYLGIPVTYITKDIETLMTLAVANALGFSFCRKCRRQIANGCWYALIRITV